MDTLIPLARDASALLIKRKETIAIAESSAGGLIAAALLSVPGASAYFLGGSVIYTKDARRALLGIDDLAMQGFRPSSEPYAHLLARTVQARHGAVWGLGETGATGPTGNRYGDPAGHACIGIAGPVQDSWTIATHDADRVRNMRRFAHEALQRLNACLQKS